MIDLDRIFYRAFLAFIEGIKSLKLKDIIILPFSFLASYGVYKLIILWLSSSIFKHFVFDYNLIFILPYIVIYLSFIKGRQVMKAKNKLRYKFELVGLKDKKDKTPQLIKEFKYDFTINNWLHVFKDDDNAAARQLLGVKRRKQGFLKRLISYSHDIQYLNFKHDIAENFFNIAQYKVYPRRKKELYKDMENKFYKHTERTFYFSSNIPLKKWVSVKADIENVFNTNVLSIEYKKNSKKIIVLKCIDILPKDEIIYKDTSRPLTDRYADILYRLGVNVSDLDYKELKTVTKICFNSEEKEKTIESIVPELKSRMRIRNRTSLLPGENTDYEICIYKKIDKIYFKDMFFNHIGIIKSMYLPILLGMCENGRVIIKDLCKDMYHIVVAGTTGGGKSTILHSLISSLLLARKNVVLALLDPKKVELKDYRHVKNVVYANNTKDIIAVMKGIVEEMDKRNDKILEIPFCKNIETYNKRTGENLPYIVVVVEEIADLIEKSEDDSVKTFNSLLKRLAQVGRSAGIRLVLSTQKPNHDTISTYIKANCLTRFGFMTSNETESKVILDNDKCKSITEMGAFIFQNRGVDKYVKGAYLSDLDLNDVIKEVTNE